MSRWFRWYEGTSEDGKFRVVARLSRATVRDAIALWAFMLEDASNLDHRGVCARNEDFMASILDFEDGIVERILESMESIGMISVGHGAITICNFGKRQFEGDTDPTAAERQRRKRERDKATSNDPVTRDSRPPDTDTDTDTDTEKKEKEEANASSKKKAADPRGYRLPEDFSPLPNVIELAHNLGLSDAEIKFEIAQFTDYWRSRAGEKARKTDWNATLRNWLRKSHADRKSGYHKRQSPGEAMRSAFAEQREFLNRPLPDS